MKSIGAAAAAILFLTAWMHGPEAVKERMEDAAPKAKEVAASMRDGFDLLGKLLSTPAPDLRLA